MWWIQSVYVVDEFRKRGLFRRLYDYVKQKALSAGAGRQHMTIRSTEHNSQQGVVNRLHVHCQAHTLNP